MDAGNQPGPIRWITAFVDLPSPLFDRGVQFWAAVTGSTRSPARGRHDEFATLLPSNGDAFLRVQRVNGGGVHLDLHVDDIAAFVDRSTALGAVVRHDDGYCLLRSPAGLDFCVVSYQGDAIRPLPTVTDGVPNLVDQVSIDIPAADYDAECAFWSSVTGWALHASPRSEFSYLTRPSAMPLRLLLQRLGEDDSAGVTRAHLDLACGPDLATLTASHERRGAVVRRRTDYWTTLVDPAGREYCLTNRDPITGTLAT